MTNNLIIFDGVTPFGNVVDPNVTQTTNLIISTANQDPGFVNLAGTILPTDFDLTASSPAINAGTVLSNLPVDYLNRAAPDASGKTDIGAFEYGSTVVSTPPPSSPAPISATGGPKSGSGSSGCSCRIGQATSPGALGLGILGFAVLARRRFRRRG